MYNHRMVLFWHVCKRWYVCICMCVCVFIKLHIIAQSGSVILLSHSMPFALILPRGIKVLRDRWYSLLKPPIRRDKGDTLSLLVQFLLIPRVPCAPPPLLPCHSLDYLGWQLLNHPFSIPTQVSPGSHIASTTLVRLCMYVCVCIYIY